MNIQLVELSTCILRLYCAQNKEARFGVNEIFKKTGNKNKPKIVEAIKELEKAKIFRTEKARKKYNKEHKQKESKVLTELGQDIVDFMTGIELSHKTYLNLKAKINRLILSLDKKENAQDEKYKLEKDRQEFLKKYLDSFNFIDTHKYYINFLSYQDVPLLNLFRTLDEYRKNIINCLIYGYYKIMKNLLSNRIERSISKKLIEEILQRIIFDEIKQTILEERLLENVFHKEDKEYIKITDIGKSTINRYISNLMDSSNTDLSDVRWNHKESADMDFAVRLIVGDRNDNQE
jgi:hypothetical protein